MDYFVYHLGSLHVVLEIMVWAGQLGNEMSERSLRKYPSSEKVTGLHPAQLLTQQGYEFCPCPYLITQLSPGFFLLEQGQSGRIERERIGLWSRNHSSAIN